eukprot:15317619-Alexandrium_andersonii.AAC.1
MWSCRALQVGTRRLAITPRGFIRASHAPPCKARLPQSAAHPAYRSTARCLCRRCLGSAQPGRL